MDSKEFSSTISHHLFHQVKKTAENVDDAVRELPDANTVFFTFYYADKKYTFFLLTSQAENWLRFLIQYGGFCCVQKPEDLWANHCKIVQPKPHRKNSLSWEAIQKVLLCSYIIIWLVNACTDRNELFIHTKFCYNISYMLTHQFVALSSYLTVVNKLAWNILGQSSPWALVTLAGIVLLSHHFIWFSW